MKKYILSNYNLPFYLIYGGMLLSFLSTPLAVYDIVESGSFLSRSIHILGMAVVIAGVILRFYFAKQAGNLKILLLQIGIGVACVVALFVMDVIQTPSFLQNIF